MISSKYFYLVVGSCVIGIYFLQYEGQKTFECLYSFAGDPLFARPGNLVAPGFSIRASPNCVSSTTIYYCADFNTSLHQVV